MEIETNTFYPSNREAWRNWLHENHKQKDSVWLIYFKKNSKKPSIAYSDAVDEALCFGWIDSKAKPLDYESYMQFFCKRKEKSVWSKINKAKIESLTKRGLMMEAGLEIIEKAKQNGSWTILDEPEALIVPTDLSKAFENKTDARNYFESLSRSDKRNILQWLVLAKKEETRKKRIDEIVESASQRLKPKPFR